MIDIRRFRGRRRLTVVGLVATAGVLLAGTALAESPAAAAAHKEALVPGTPCTVSAKSCVDLDSQRAWLFSGGTILRGPVPVATGGDGQATPVGHSLRVYRKDANHKSQESRLPNGAPAPMPNSVFFEDGGIAFHSGSPSRSSAGCVHLNPDDAKAWFDYLQIGDKVQVVSAKAEMAARGGH
ncbi:L,D-transpeptidase [Pseudonocardia endophytica]|uniref:L,D-transpeptidase-like protein n=1 Tax=Pseudonocardia endophytica TaxID=401976 RepID=A0A4R1HCY8_PSEEN|nr:L,D-transpeptidase [Pseudonocardia endophytica]TCK19897.1 L,D-transpeptidase-like protein [Pseudonocardia endophytica]